MASALIGNLAVSLTMSTAAFQRGATIAEKRAETMKGRFAAATTSVKGLGAALGVALGADVLYRIAAGAFEMASSLSEAAEQVGVTVEGLQELRFAAEQTGVGTDKIEAAMKRLSRSLGDLERGKASAVKAFEEIGLSADELRGKRPDEALRIIADALNKIPDASARVAIGQQLMGRSFSDLLPLINGGSAALDEYSEESRRNGQISTEDAAKLDELADTWGRFKTQVSIATANIIADVIPMAEKIGAALDATKKFFWDLGQSMTISTASIEAAISGMVNGIQNWVGNKLNAIWDSVTRKIEAVKASFWGLYDAVIGHSYVPDMVDGIATEMGRLDAVMVAPVTAATSKAQEAFRDMAADVRGLLDKLFPEVRAAMDFDADEALINKLPEAMREEARRRQWSDFVTGSPFGGGGPDRSIMDTDPIDQRFEEGLERFNRRMEDFGKKAAETTVRVAKSFKDMADDTLSSLGQLTSAIKGGGFLSILESVIGLGLQLGSIGAFGGKVQSRLNGTATGYSAPRGGGGTNVVEIVDTTGLFVTRVNGQIQQAAPAIARAGGASGIAQSTFQRSRSLA